MCEHVLEDCIRITIVLVWVYASRSFNFDLARTINVGSGSRAQVVLLIVFRVRVGGSFAWLYLDYSCVEGVKVCRGALLMISDQTSEVKM